MTSKFFETVVLTLANKSQSTVTFGITFCWHEAVKSSGAKRNLSPENNLGC